MDNTIHVQARTRACRLVSQYLQKLTDNVAQYADEFRTVSSIIEPLGRFANRPNVIDT
jgi:hypothetical protein